MKLTDQLTDYINAAFTGLWVQTSEPDEAEREIVRHAQQKKWKLAVWDIANGVRLPPAAGNSRPDASAGDPLAALRALPALADSNGTALLLLLHQFHRFLNNPEVIQTTFSQLIAGKQQRTFIVVLSPVVQIPVEKAQALAKSKLCSLYRGETRSFANLRGVDHIRRLTAQLLRPDCPVPPKGWPFVGAPNSGKTTVAKAIAADNGMPLILGDLPSLKTKYVGESEGRVRQFTGLCEAMAPCCVLLDEVEDVLAGATGEQSGDSGVSRDQLSTILKWRSESKARVFLICTCNEPQSLLRVKQGALFRDGRFDGIVFFDLPDREAKDGIWTIYRHAYQIASTEPNPPDDGWAPENIEVCCQRAVQYQIPLAEAARYVRSTSAEDIERLREWASGRCLSASAPGIYAPSANSLDRPSRRVNRPSNN